MTTTATRVRPTIIALLATIVGLSGASATATSALAATHNHSKHHHSRKHSTRHHKSTHHSSGIPQGNVGDNDADNHGGPSDGDGNI